MVLRVRIDSSDAVRQYREIGSANLTFINDAQAETFADTLEAVTRVDTGELQESVGSEGNVAGYGINFPQRIGKMLAAHNFERFRVAQSLSELPIRVQTGRLMQALLNSISRGRLASIVSRLRRR